MKRFVFAFLAILFMFLNCLPSSLIFADSGYTDSQLADIGTLMLADLIQSGEATELDFSDYTENDGLDFLIGLGELAVTGDPTGLVEQGLDWLGDEINQTYEDLIWSIREWEYSIAPDLYNWWYNGSDYEIKLEPVSNVSKPLIKLLTPPGDVEPSPEPPIDYSWFNIVGTYALGSERIDFTAAPFRWSSSNPNSTISNIKSYDNLCFYSANGQINNSLTSNNGINTIQLTDLFNIYITHSGSNYYVDYSDLGSYYSSNTYWLYNNNYYNTAIELKYNSNGTFSPWNGLQLYNSRGSINSFSGLSSALNWVYNHFRHVNVYVDGVQWVSVIQSPTYPIVIPNGLTVLNEQPAQYTFSEPTYIDINGLKTLITNAINASDILTWQDIDDYFLDVNGVQALPTIQIIRNDYDNMYLEQYPYPATLIGFQDPLKFNEHMLDNVSGQYLTPMVNVAQNTVDILPSELKWVLGIGAILSIFALIINRLLE